MNETKDRERIFKEKEKYHKRLARLNFEKKLEVLGRLQKIAAAFREVK